MKTDETSVLELRNVTVSYRMAAAPAVSDVSVGVRRGSCLALVGESGSGKTTLGRAIAGMLPVGARRSGAIDVTGRVTYMMQDAPSALNPIRRVAWQLSGALKASGVARSLYEERSLDLLSEAGLAAPTQVLRKYPHELSGGQAQRVLLATALATMPSVLVADEPTSALDVTTQARVMDQFRRLVDGGLCLVLITHDLVAASRVSDTIIILRDGKVVEQGPTDVITTTPAHPYTRQLLAAAMMSGHNWAEGEETDVDA